MKVLIVVKTYPAISKKYGEIVCTAGITEEGKWIRIYPLPFRKIKYDQRFHKYQWIDMDLIRNEKDFRSESYRPVDYQKYKILDTIKADGGAWTERRKLVLKNVYTDMQQLIADAKNKDKLTSIAVFKPKDIQDFTFEKTDEEWSKDKIQYLESEKKQGKLFETEEEENIENFEVVPKLPYKFSFIFTDCNGKSSKMMIEDWEIGMLYWNSLERHQGNEERACEDVRKKYFDDFAKTKDYYFILGTTLKHHHVSKNPFVIIGDFRPKHIEQEQMELFS